MIIEIFKSGKHVLEFYNKYGIIGATLHKWFKNSPSNESKKLVEWEFKSPTSHHIKPRSWKASRFLSSHLLTCGYFNSLTATKKCS
jgi:hypothetical protein